MDLTEPVPQAPQNFENRIFESLVGKQDHPPRYTWEGALEEVLCIYGWQEWSRYSHEMV
jgi:hypothetical protein